MGRGSSKAGSGSAGAKNPKVEKTLSDIIRRTKNLKKEQYRVLDDDGNVIFTKKGDKGAVYMTVGEKREYLDNATTIHNHPNEEGIGGTFSSQDMSDFGYGAREIVVAAPEGTYRLRNLNHGTPQQKETWVEMRQELEKIDAREQDKSFIQRRDEAQKTLRNSKEVKLMDKYSKQWNEMREKGASQEELKKVSDKYMKAQETYKKRYKKIMRQQETKPYHDWLKKNAKKYGFEYTAPKGVY